MMDIEKKYMEKLNVNNPVQEWIDTDKKLYAILKEIEATTKSETEQAKTAFNRLAKEYNLPKYIDDIEDRETQQVGDYHLYDPISMYEVLGQLKFVDKNLENLKSNVLLAAYIVKNKLEPFIDEELDQYLGEDELAGFGYRGENIEVELIPIKVGENWFDLGCKYFIKDV